MPDYSVILDDSDMVTFSIRGTVPSLEKPREHSLPVDWPEIAPCNFA
jgi:hypothetical protein